MTKSQATIAIPSPFPPGDKFYSTVEKFYIFWDLPSTAEWFKKRGYTLYRRKEPGYEGRLEASTYPALECAVSGKMDYPSAHYDLGTSITGKLHGRSTNGKIAFAQETRNPSHHVVIKLVVTDSEEHRVLTFLQMQGLKVLEENCLVPVLKILPNGPYAFVIMSRWGDCAHQPEGGPLRNCFRTIHSLLKALSFLHEHNILHRDIKPGNILVSHFSDDDFKLYRDNALRGRLQWTDELQYCLCDFDLSMMLPPETNRKQHRLPYWLSWDGSGWQTHDTSQGEFDYNPFVFDVGTLGVILCTRYQHLSHQVPMLAPFLDRMTTRDIPKRFSAGEALKFFEDNLLHNVAVADLNKCCSVCPEPSQAYDVYNRWKDLSPDFIKEWGHYKEPPVPLRTAFLRWLCSYKLMATVVPSARLYFHHVTSFCLSIFARVFYSPVSE